MLDGASPAASKEMKRTIKYVLDTESMALKLKPALESRKGIWKFQMYSNSDYVVDTET